MGDEGGESFGVLVGMTGVAFALVPDHAGDFAGGLLFGEVVASFAGEVDEAVVEAFFLSGVPIVAEAGSAFGDLDEEDILLRASGGDGVAEGEFGAELGGIFIASGLEGDEAVALAEFAFVAAGGIADQDLVERFGITGESAFEIGGLAASVHV